MTYVVELNIRHPTFILLLIIPRIVSLADYEFKSEYSQRVEQPISRTAYSTIYPDVKRRYDGRLIQFQTT